MALKLTKVDLLPFLTLLIKITSTVDPTCRPGDKSCAPFFGPPQDMPLPKVLIIDDIDVQNKKYILLSDAYENSTSPDIEFRLFQQKVLNFTELGALKIQDAQTSTTVGLWAIRIDPVSPWQILQEVLATNNSGVLLTEFSSVRLQNIRNPGLAQLTLQTTKEGPEISQPIIVLLKFVMPLPLAARIRVQVQTAKIFSTVNNYDFASLPFINVQDIFTMTLGPPIATEVLQEANRSVIALPSSKTLEKKMDDFMQKAVVVPKDFTPGIYLKPKANYGLLATLEFLDGSGNTSKILYEHGEVYLHIRDKLRLIPNIASPSPVAPTPQGNLEFYIRCWDGTSAVEAALGPAVELKINFDSLLAQALVGCDGAANSSAVINECGLCVLGDTGKPENYSKDLCGVCNGSNECIGCDGQPNSGAVIDACGLCRHPNDDNFNKGCGASLSHVRPKVASIVNGTLFVNITGIAPSTLISCWLQFISSFSDHNTMSYTSSFNVTVNMSRTNSNSSENATDLVLHWDYANSAGVYGVRCVTANKVEVAALENTSHVYLVDYNILQLSSANPSVSYFGDSSQNMTVEVTGIFIPTITNNPRCVGQDRRTNESYTFPAEIRSDQHAYCNLTSIVKAKLLDLRVAQHADIMADVMSRQRPLNVTVKAMAPKVVYAKFTSSALEITVKFDVNVIANGSCQQIFDEITVSKFGNQPSCRFTADELRVTLGANHQINIDDSIHFKENALYPADADFFDYLSSDSSVTVGGPEKAIVPTVYLDSPLTVSTCTDQVRLSVRKVTGDGGRDMSYQWTVINATETSTNSSISIPSNLQNLMQSAQSQTVIIPTALLADDVTYIFDIVGCNFFNQCSAGAELVLNIANNMDTQMSVQILGLDPPIRCGSHRHLRASAALKMCDTVQPLTSNLLFRWEVFTKNGTMISTGDEWTYILRTGAIEPGEKAEVRVEAFYDDFISRNYSAQTMQTITCELQPLWIRLGAATRKQGAMENLLLDASASYDPNKQTYKLYHDWTCNRLDPSADNDTSKRCYVKSNSTGSSLFEEYFGNDQPMLTLPANAFDPGVYNFTDTVQSGTLEEKGSTIVTLTPGIVPLIQMLPLAVQKPAIDQSITFRADVYATENVTVALNFEGFQGFGVVKLPDELKQRTHVDVPASAISPGGYIFSFTLPSGQTGHYPGWTGLAPATTYAAKLVATSASGRTGESFITFGTNEPPTTGTLTISTIPQDSPIYALTTPLHLEANGFTDQPEDLPLSYQFGIRKHTANGKMKEQWFPVMVQVEEAYLYLPSAESSRPACDRIGYQAMVKVCDIHGACTQAIAPSQPFQVKRPENMTLVLELFVQEIETDLANGNTFGACSKVTCLIEESCVNLSAKMEETSQAAAAHILGRIAPTSDKDDIIEAMTVANDILLRPNAAVDEGLVGKLEKGILGLERYYGMNESSRLTMRRKKREAASNSQNPVDSESVTQLLGAYEIIVSHSKDADAVSVYLRGTAELLAQMCSGRDATQAAMLAHSKGISAPLCAIEAQGLFIDSSILHMNISIAAVDEKHSAQVQIGPGLQEAYTLWPCNGGRSTCTTVCLATAVYFLSNGSGATPVGQYVARNGSTPLSDVHLVQLVDPISKESLQIKRPNWEHYVVFVPLVRIGSSGYYSCQMFTNAQEWSQNHCEAAGVNTMQGGGHYVICRCHTFGYVAVFESHPPQAPDIAPLQPVRVSLTVDNFKMVNTDYKNKTLTSLAFVMNTSARRIVDLEITKPDEEAVGRSPGEKRVLNFVLRPPSRFDWSDSSQLLVRIHNGTASADQMTDELFTWRIVPQSLHYSPVSRELKNDFNSRMITLKALNDYETTVMKSGAGALASTLTTQLATAIGISRSRITDMAFYKGSTIIKFTIQSPGTKSINSSSEMAAWILIDQIRYDELALIDVYANPLIFDGNATTVQEVDRNATQATNDVLPAIIGGTVGSVFFVVIIVVIVLVAIKIRGRTDKVSPITTPNSTSPNDSQRNSAQSSVSVRRISITDDRNGSSLRSRRH